MGKVFIENNIGKAIDIVNNTIAKDGVIDPTYRSKMSAFGGAIINNGLISAFSFYQKNEEKVVTMLRKLDNPKIERNIDYICELKGLEGDEKLERTRRIIDLSVSLKLAMNCFIKEKKDK